MTRVGPITTMEVSHIVGADGQTSFLHPGNICRCRNSAECQCHHGIIPQPFFGMVIYVNSLRRIKVVPIPTMCNVPLTLITSRTRNLNFPGSYFNVLLGLTIPRADLRDTIIAPHASSQSRQKQRKRLMERTISWEEYLIAHVKLVSVPRPLSHYLHRLASDNPRLYTIPDRV